MHSRLNEAGEEFLEGRNCKCGKPSFCFSMADRSPIVDGGMSLDGSQSSQFLLDPAEAQGFHKRRLQAEGYEIIELPNPPKRSRAKSSGSKVRQRKLHHQGT